MFSLTWAESMRPILKAMEIWGTDYKKSIPD